MGKNENFKDKKSKKKSNKGKNLRRKRILKIIRNIFIFVLLIMLMFIFYSIYNLGKLNNNSVKLESTISKDDNFINILAMGVDIGDASSKDKNIPKRTDTMILINYNKSKKRLSLVSIPRDTLVTINNKKQKLNVAHAIGGPKLTVEKVEELLGVRIDYYGKVDYEGFRALIDALGGVDVEVKYDMKYDDDAQDLHINFTKGKTEHLDGKRAEEFFRWRKNNDGTGLVDGDIGRIKNQQQLIDQVMKKFKSPSIIFRLTDIVSTIPKFVETNMNAADMLSFSSKLIGLKKENISLKTLAGEGKYINKVSYFVYDEAESREVLNLIKQINYVDINRGKLKINILNETNKSGLASNLKEYIEGKGYKNISTGNKTGQDKTKIILYGVSTEIADKITEDFKIYNKEIIDKKSGEYDVVVLLGYDHDYINE